MIDDRPITDVKKRPLQGRRAKAALRGALRRKDMWTRSCAVCKALLHKPQLS